MPYIHLNKIWTPLELVNIQIFRSTERRWYIKLGSRKIRSMRG